MLIIVLLTFALAAEPADPDQEEARRDEIARLAPAKARQIEILVGESDDKAIWHAEPLLRWSNPTAGSVHGEVFLWTYKERPVAVASIYRWYHPFKDCTFEVVSTSSLPVVAREGNKTVWESKESAIAWKSLEAAPAPAKTATSRLSQLRRLARRFSAELVDKRTGEEAVTRELRLLNQPMYRYAADDKGVIDGALFAFAESTDPEALLLIEAVQRDDKTIWQYALARMNADACEVRLDDKPVGGWEKIYQPWRHTQAPYTLVGFQPDEVKVEEEAKK